MKQETYEEAVERIKKENAELIKQQWVGIIALFIAIIDFILIVFKI